MTGKSIWSVCPGLFYCCMFCMFYRPRWDPTGNTTSKPSPIKQRVLQISFFGAVFLFIQMSSLGHECYLSYRADDLVGVCNGFDPFQIIVLMSYLWKLSFPAAKQRCCDSCLTDTGLMRLLRNSSTRSVKCDANVSFYQSRNGTPVWTFSIIHSSVLRKQEPCLTPHL